jgi:ankyrin repeat protein
MNELLLKPNIRNDINEIKKLVDAGANINYKNGELFLYACENNNMTIVSYLLFKRIKTNFNEAMFISIQNNNIKIVELLLKKVNIFKILKKCYSIASEKNRIDIIKFFVNLKYYNDDSIDVMLWTACRKNNMDLFNYVFEKFDPSIYQLDSALRISFLYERYEIIEILIKNGASVLTLNNFCLKIAEYTGNEKLKKIYFQNKCF